jgi:hypothetical protein
MIPTLFLYQSTVAGSDRAYPTQTAWYDGAMGRKRKLKKQRAHPRSTSASAGEPPPHTTPDPLERFSLPLGFVSALAFLGTYVPTLYPSVPGGDSGELIVAAYRLGVAHPPGYPLFTLLSKLSTLIPVGSVAWRVNLLTAVLGAIAAAILTRATWKLTRSFGAGLFAGGLFAFSPLVWSYAIQAEVFSLNNLVVAILILLLVSFEVERNETILRWFCFWLGLGLANHHTLLFCGAPIGLWMLYRAPRVSLRWPRVLALPGCGVLGLTPYLYLFVSPADHPATTWGDTSTLSGFFAHLLRKQYGTFQLGTMEEGGSLVERLLAWLAQLPIELLWVGPLLALLAVVLPATGKVRYASDQARVVTVVVVALVVYLVVFGSLTKISLEDPFWYEVHSRFWQQANLIVCLLAGVGLAWLVRPVGRKAPVVALAIAVVAVGTQGGIHYRSQDHGKDRLVATFARALLEQLPPSVLLVSKGDLYWNSMRYVQVCEGVRPDVRLLDVELLKAPWMTARVERSFDEVKLPGRVYRAPSRAVAGSYDLAGLFDANADRFALLSNALQHGDSSWKERYAAWPEGLLDRVHPKDEVLGIDRWLAETERWIDEVGLEFPDDLPRGSWERVAREEYHKVESRRGTHLLAEALGRSLGDDYFRRAGVILEEAAAMREEPSAPLYLNLGIAYYMLRGSDPGAVQKMIAAWTRYLELAPSDDPQRALVDRALRDPHNAEIGIGSR